MNIYYSDCDDDAHELQSSISKENISRINIPVSHLKSLHELTSSKSISYNQNQLLNFLISSFFTDWFICYFRVLGKSFRGDFWRVLTCFPGSFRSIFRSKFPEKIAENPFKTLLKPFKGP